MCCFSTTTEVHGTSIFARFTTPRSQALVYQMRYTATQPTAMILPLPIALRAREDSVRFKSLKDYPTFFDDLALGYPALRRSTGAKSAPEGQAVAAAAAPPLAVHEVGDFVASFVPTINDFGRVDPRFTIPKGVWDRIPAYADYGFAVFQLKELSGSPHPIAFDFDTRSPEALFFPTVHIHDGTVHDKDHFDHVLYAQDAVLDRRAGDYDGPEAVDDRTGLVRSKEKASSFADPRRTEGVLEPGLLVHKSVLRGTLPNRDTPVSLRAIATRGGAGGCGRCDAGPAALETGIRSSLPAAATIAGLGWVIRRRNLRPRS